MTKSNSPKGLNGTQKMTIRAVLATGATLVTLMGAQTLAFLDKSAFQASETTDTAQASADDSNINVASLVTNPAAVATATLQPSNAKAATSTTTSKAAATVTATATATKTATATATKAAVTTSRVQPAPRTRTSRR